jgi:hypothetical protein
MVVARSATSFVVCRDVSAFVQPIVQAEAAWVAELIKARLLVEQLCFCLSLLVNPREFRLFPLETTAL